MVRIFLIICFVVIEAFALATWLVFGEPVTAIPIGLFGLLALWGAFQTPDPE